jgi:hypothetical protein
MKLLVPKNGKSLLGQEFKLACKRTRHARIAVPFFTNERAIKLLLSEGATLQMIVRLCSVTRLDLLDKLANDDKVKIKICIGDWFHTKLYLFDRSIAIFGSANLTLGGLQSNHELSAVLTDDASIDSCHEVFEKLWVYEHVHDFDSDVSAVTRKILTQEKLAKRKAEDNADLADLKNLLDNIIEARRKKMAEANLKLPDLDVPDNVAPQQQTAMPKTATQATGYWVNRPMQMGTLETEVFNRAVARLKARPDLPLKLTPIWKSVPGAKPQTSSIAGLQLTSRGIAKQLDNRSYIATEGFRSAVESGNIASYLIK